MKRVVILGQAEWDGLPSRLAAVLERRADEESGLFGIVSRETGRPVIGPFRVWLESALSREFARIGTEHDRLRALFEGESKP